MKLCYILIFFVLTIGPFTSVAQEHKLRDGAYRTADDFLNGIPLKISKFKLVWRGDETIKYFGGSRYKLVPENDKGSVKKIFKYGVWGVVYRDTLYLNNLRYSRNKGYNRVVYLGNEFALTVGYVTIDDEIKTGSSFEERESKLASIPYRRGVAFSFSKNKFYLLNDNGMMWLIKDYPDLVNEFNELLKLSYTDNDFEIIKRFQIIKKLDKLMTEGGLTKTSAH